MYFICIVYCLQVAVQLLEKDIHDKQDTLISLRRQLQDIKTINLDLYTKWQVVVKAVIQNHHQRYICRS